MQPGNVKGIEPMETKEAYQRYLDTSVFGSLNGLRCLCILVVMWHHSPALEFLSSPTLFLRRGFLGVDFFFVLSGFLITTLLLREEARNGFFSLRDFYRRRILRIVPVYFLVVTLMVVYFVILKGQDEHWPRVAYYYLFFANMLVGDIPLLTVTWSLSVEEQYYLMWPALLLLLPMRAEVRLWTLIGLIAFCVASASGALGFVGLHPIETKYAIWKLPATGYEALLLGSFAGVVLNTRSGFAVLHTLLGGRYAPVVAFGVLWVSLMSLPDVLTGLPNLVVHSVMTVCLVTLVVREDHVLAGVFAWKPVARVGEISYGLYLYHLIGRHVGVEFMRPLGLSDGLAAWLSTGMFVVVSVLIAELSFRTFERYFLSLKETSTGRMKTAERL
jgi:peptidoglycan/LPS O-acetylase OafA/YrhL